MINNKNINLSSSTLIDLESYLNIGFIQTILDGDLSWDPTTGSINMLQFAQEKVWHEIKKGFTDLKSDNIKPNIIVLPELTLPHCYLSELRRLSQEIGAVVIAGLDFVENANSQVENKAVVIVPNRWPEFGIPSRNSAIYYFGKIYFSEEENILFSDKNIRKNSAPHPNTYIFDTGKFGKIGVAICSDFFDLERFIIYRGRIHHLIIISHNKDINSYYYLAEAISRIVFCNVIICNTGYFGDSLAFSPFRENYDRTIYRHTGQKLFSTQVVKVPVKDLDEAQEGNDPDKKFKAKPPGYVKL